MQPPFKRLCGSGASLNVDGVTDTKNPGSWLARRVELALQWRLCAANLAGALVVFVYFTFLYPLSFTQAAQVGNALYYGAFAGYMIFALVSATILGRRMFRTVLEWLEAQRPPTPEERKAVLSQPFKQAWWPFAYWVIAAALFAVLHLYFDPLGTGRHAVRIAVGILGGGLTTCTLAFLLIERSFRPLFALALAGEAPARPVLLGIRPRLLLSWALGSAIPLLGIGMTLLAGDAEQGQSARLLFIVMTGLISGGMITIIAARSVADPVEKVRAALRQVQSGNVDVQLELDDGGELGLLQAGFNRMVSGLRERERLQELFGRYVGTEVARQAIEQGVGLTGEQREVSVLFVDLIDSTALAAARPADEVVSHLNALFDAVVKAVSDEGGWVNKFEGDGAMCVFGAPTEQTDHAERALRAARRLREEIVSLGAIHPGLDVGIGVSSGRVVAGNVGAAHRYEYTVIGDPVNEAARLVEEAKRRPSRVLVSQTTVERARDAERRVWNEASQVTLRGRSTPTLAYEPRASVPAAVRD